MTAAVDGAAATGSIVVFIFFFFSVLLGSVVIAIITIIVVHRLVAINNITIIYIDSALRPLDNFGLDFLTGPAPTRTRHGHGHGLSPLGRPGTAIQFRFRPCFF
jgi:hypothetical protein